MPLTTGSRLGAYEIIAAIGAGAWRGVSGEDTTLHRDVASKSCRVVRNRSRTPRTLHARGAGSRLASIIRTSRRSTTRRVPSTSALVMELVEARHWRSGSRKGRSRWRTLRSQSRSRSPGGGARAGHIHRDLKPREHQGQDDAREGARLRTGEGARSGSGGSRCGRLTNSPTITSPLP